MIRLAYQKCAALRQDRQRLVPALYHQIGAQVQKRRRQIRMEMQMRSVRLIYDDREIVRLLKPGLPHWRQVSP